MTNEEYQFHAAEVRKWMPLWIGDYLADTAHLTTEEHGAYFLLLMHYWKHGELSACDKQCSSIARCTPRKWKSIKKTVLKFFVIDQLSVRHNRADEEFKKAVEAKIKSVKRAKKAANKRWSKDARGNAQAHAQALPEKCPSPSPIYTTRESVPSTVTSTATENATAKPPSPAPILEKQEYAAGISMTKQELAELVKTYSKPAVRYYLETCSDYLAANNRTTSDGAAYVRRFMREDKLKQKGFFSPSAGAQSDMSKHPSRRIVRAKEPRPEVKKLAATVAYSLGLKD